MSASLTVKILVALLLFFDDENELELEDVEPLENELDGLAGELPLGEDMNLPRFFFDSESLRFFEASLPLCGRSLESTAMEQENAEGLGYSCGTWSFGATEGFKMGLCRDLYN